MKITIVTDVLGTANNGTSLAALNLINTLKQKGHEIRVVCPDENKIGVPGYYVLPKYNFGFLNKYVKRNGVVVAKCDPEIIEEACKDADIVHSLLPFSAGRAAVKYCLKHHIPITSGFHAQAENITSHLFAINNKLANFIAYKNLWHHYYKYVDSIHYPTQFICDLMNKYKYIGPKSYPISNGVQSNLFFKKDVTKPDNFKDKFVIIMSGRFSHEKNQIMLLKAVKNSKYESKIQIILAGDGPTKEKLYKYSIKNLTNTPIMRHYEHESLSDVLNTCDLYVHTSIAEIEAISCLEALACGLVPVISDSSKSATSKFSLRKESSYNHKSVKDLTNKIDYWIEHPQERKKASIEYIEFAKQFDFNICMDKMEEMLFETIKNYQSEKPWLKRRK